MSANDNSTNQRQESTAPELSPPELSDQGAQKKKGFWSKLGVVGAVLLALTKILKLGKLATVGKVIFTALKASKFAGTFISMAITIAIYAQFYGWLFALGFVVAIFIHECGHVLASKQVGLKVSAPMFIPFLGAFISLKEQPKSVRQEAISAIGGPLAGTLAAVICLVFWDITGSPYWIGLAYVTALINLFNLLPLGMLDGGRITKALSPLIWVLGIIIAVILIWKMQIYILVLVLLFGIIEIVQMFRNRKELAAYLEVEPRFRFRIGASYLLLLVVLAGLMMYSLDISQTFIHSLRG